MIRILFLINSLGGGGAEKVLVNLVNNLDKTKYEVSLQTIFNNGVNIKDLNKNVRYIPGLKIMPKGNVVFFRMFSPKKLYSFFIKDDYDIVVAFLEGVASRIVSGCTNKNIKKIAWIHGEHDNIQQISYPFGSKLKAEQAYNSMDKIVCVANTVKENLLSLLNITVPVEVFYNVNETNKIIEQSNETVDEKILDDTINIVSVGRLIDVKGYDRLIKIHKKLLDNGIKNKVLILGNGNKKEQLIQQTIKFGVKDTFCFMGFSRNPYKYVAKSDLFVCSSRREGFSTAVTEALICGVPVVSTNVSGANELLGYNNEYGIVTDNDEVALYNGIYKMITEKGLLEYYRKQAKIRGEEFSTKKTTKAIEEMLESL